MKDTRIVLCGQAPGKGGDPRRPLVGGITGHRLQQLSGLSVDAYVGTFDRCNVLDYWPGYARPKGDVFPMRVARAAARQKALGWDGRVVVFVGRAVANAFLVGEDVAYFEWGQMQIEVPVEVRYRFAVIPHASPVNLFWNDSANVAAARRFFDALLRRAA